MRSAGAEPARVTVDLRLCHVDGAVIPFALTFTNLLEDPTVEGIVATGHDISDRVAVEDAPPGIVAAMTVGMRTIGVTNTVSEKELRSAGAEVVTRTLADWTTDAVHHLFD